MPVQYTTLDGSVLIPLLSTDSDQVVRAYATVDAADAEWVNQWQWKLSAKRGAYPYRYEYIDGKSVNQTLHRALLGLEPGDERQGDHIDRNHLNNRRSNLRILPKGANAQNVSSHAGSSSKYRGVSWSKSKKRWRASIHVNGKVISLGDFKDEDAAGEAARAARRKWMPYAVD